MKRFLVGFLLVAVCGIAPALASNNVLSAQTKLKEGGFYFGETNGAFSSELAAAITRYQIRNGLQISGQLDEPTAKSLGVAPAVTQAAEPATWQQLRKTDQQFLARQNSRNPAPPAPKSKTAARPVAAPVEPAPAAEETFTLSRERLRDYVGAFVLAGLNPTVGSELEFFADRVDYYDQGMVDRAKLRADLRSYNEQWPQRRFWIAGPVQVEPRPDSRLRVTFPLRYALQNGAKRSSGKVQKSIVVEVVGQDELQIVAVNERKAR